MFSHQQWRSSYKAVFVLSMVAVALSFTACAKGFKLKEDLKKGAVPVAAVAVQPTTSTYEPLLGLAAEKSPEIAKMVADPNNRGRIQLDGKIGFIFSDLDPSKGLSAETSVLYFELTAKVGNQTAGALLVSDGATLNVTATNSSDVRITGYWTINRPNAQPLYVGIDSRVVINGVDLILEGGLYGNFHGTNEGQQLSQINVPLCNVLAETAWLKQVYGEYVEDSTCTIITY